MPTIQHIAHYCLDLEALRTYYCNYFGAASNGKYVNAKKRFASYFLSFEDGSALEIMSKNGIEQASEIIAESLGFIHLAFSVSLEEKVIKLTERIRKDGYNGEGECRWTGDDLYERVILDPERNRIEIMI
ncbi:MAG: lactoylglutathione lyase [Arcticibacterium sp.]|jgi:lactoylglutathione lyase